MQHDEVIRSQWITMISMTIESIFCCLLLLFILHVAHVNTDEQKRIQRRRFSSSVVVPFHAQHRKLPSILSVTFDLSFPESNSCSSRSIVRTMFVVYSEQYRWKACRERTEGSMKNSVIGARNAIDNFFSLLNTIAWVNWKSKSSASSENKMRIDYTFRKFFGSSFNEFLFYGLVRIELMYLDFDTGCVVRQRSKKNRVSLLILELCQTVNSAQINQNLTEIQGFLTNKSQTIYCFISIRNAPRDEFFRSGEKQRMFCAKSNCIHWRGLLSVGSKLSVLLNEVSLFLDRENHFARKFHESLQCLEEGTIQWEQTLIKIHLRPMADIFHHQTRRRQVSTIPSPKSTPKSIPKTAADCCRRWTRCGRFYTWKRFPFHRSWSLETNR